MDKKDLYQDVGTREDCTFVFDLNYQFVSSETESFESLSRSALLNSAMIPRLFSAQA